MTTPRDVILACLTGPAPCPDCGNPEPHDTHQWGPARAVEGHTALIVAALTRYGYLTDPNAPLTLGDAETAALDLAEASRHPRYDGHGWRRLLESATDVEVAWTAAEKNSGDRAERDQAAKWRSVLNQWHREQQP